MFINKIRFKSIKYIGGGTFYEYSTADYIQVFCGKYKSSSRDIDYKRFGLKIILYVIYE